MSKDECPVGNEMRWSIVLCFRVITEAAEIIHISVISIFYICRYMSAQVMTKWDIEIWSGLRHVHPGGRKNSSQQGRPYSHKATLYNDIRAHLSFEYCIPCVASCLLFHFLRRPRRTLLIPPLGLIDTGNVCRHDATRTF